METITRHIEDLLAFHWVALEGGFTRAAERIGSSKAMLSKQVSRLETQMRVRLFQRTTRMLSLTPEGTELFAYSSRIFEMADEAGRRVSELAHGEAGVVKISAPVSLGDAVLPRFFEEYGETLPGVRFELDLSNEWRDFVRDELDFGIRATESHPPDVIARYLGRLRDVICVAPGKFRGNRIDGGPESLARHDCILNATDTSWNTWQLSSRSRDVRVEVSGKYAANHYSTARRLCLGGLGIARLPYYLVAKDLEDRALVQLFPEYQITTHPLYLVYLKNAYSSRRHRAVKEALLKYFRSRDDIFIRQ